MMMSWEGNVERMGRGEMYTEFWWGNLREITIGKHRRRWEDNIKIDL